MDFDELAGLASGHISKIECGIKWFGDVSLSVTFAALGLEILIIPAELPPTVQRFCAELQRSEIGPKRRP